MLTATCMLSIIIIIGFKNSHQVRSNPPSSLQNTVCFSILLGVFTGTTVAGYSLGSGGSRSELYYPSAIRVTPNSTMFILDRSNHRILKWQDGDTLGYIVAGGNGNGGGFNQIGTSYGIDVDDQFNVYISEQTNHRVTKWFNGNTTISTLVFISFHIGLSLFLCIFKVAGGNGAGNTAEKLNSPWGIYVNANGSIFVVDRGNHRVQKWDAGA